jgi:phage shock protein C
MKMNVYFCNMNRFFEKIIALFETQIFGVCSFWGDILGISTARIRLFFIYASFLAKGSPIIFYLAWAFVMNLKKYWRLGKARLFDL